MRDFDNIRIEFKQICCKFRICCYFYDLILLIIHTIVSNALALMEIYFEIFIFIMHLKCQYINNFIIKINDKYTDLKHFY